MPKAHDGDESPAEKRLDRLVDADDAARKAAVVTKARQALIREFDQKTPDFEVVRENIAVVLDHKGYNGVFEKDKGLDTSIGEQLQKRKGDPLAKKAVDYVTDELLKRTKSESATHSANARRSNNLFSGGNDGRY